MPPQSADLDAAARALATADGVIADASRQLAARSLDEDQVIAYEVAHAAAAVEVATSMLDYGAHGVFDDDVALTNQSPFALTNVVLKPVVRQGG